MESVAGIPMSLASVAVLVAGVAVLATFIALALAPGRKRAAPSTDEDSPFADLMARQKAPGAGAPTGASRGASPSPQSRDASDGSLGARADAPTGAPAPEPVARVEWPVRVPRAELEARVRAELDQGNFIVAIKVMREHTGLGLRDAKLAVEHLRDRGRLPDGAPFDGPVGAAPSDERLGAGAAAAPEGGPSAGDGPPPHIVAAALGLARSGQKISAIKLVREATGWSLARSKDFVEELDRRSGS